MSTNSVEATWLRDATTYAEIQRAYDSCRRRALGDTPDLLFDQELDVWVRTGDRVPYDAFEHSARYEVAYDSLARSCMKTLGFQPVALHVCADTTPVGSHIAAPSIKEATCVIPSVGLPRAVARPKED